PSPLAVVWLAVTGSLHSLTRKRRREGLTRSAMLNIRVVSAVMRTTGARPGPRRVTHACMVCTTQIKQSPNRNPAESPFHNRAPVHVAIAETSLPVPHRVLRTFLTELGITARDLDAGQVCARTGRGTLTRRGVSITACAAWSDRKSAHRSR